MPAVAQASLLVLAPSGQQTRVTLEPVPFSIGRQSDNHLVLRDNRASRQHARILFEGGAYVIEDLESRHGIWVNGQRIRRHLLRESDRIDLGLKDSYELVFTSEKDGFRRLLTHFSAVLRPEEKAGDLAKLRSLVEVARALQNSLSTEEVLAAVVDAALTVTACERGFLLLRTQTGQSTGTSGTGTPAQGTPAIGTSPSKDGPTNRDELEIAVARDRSGRNLDRADLTVPTELFRKELAARRELLLMSFDPSATLATQTGLSLGLGHGLQEGPNTREGTDASKRLGLHGVCLPLVRLGSGTAEETRAISAAEDTVGLIYMDSADGAADLSAGNRELLQTLAIEASTILENARLLDEQRAKIRMEDELQIAREIQRGLLPVSLPSTGWFRAAGSSQASTEVGGDYYDVHEISPDAWVAVLADVSGKGVSSALLASLLQGAFLMVADPSHIVPRMSRLNEFLLERTKGEKYATVFYCMLEASGLFSYTNAGQCVPLLVGRDGNLRLLETTSMPVGMMEGAPFQMLQTQLSPGDKIVIYSDGLTEAEGAKGKFFGNERLRRCARENAGLSAAGLHAALMDAVEQFVAQPAEQSGRNEKDAKDAISDDITALVIEYAK